MKYLLFLILMAGTLAVVAIGVGFFLAALWEIGVFVHEMLSKGLTQ